MDINPKAILEIVNHEHGQKMLEVIERSTAVRRVIYAGFGIGYLYGASALVHALASMLK